MIIIILCCLLSSLSLQCTVQLTRTQLEDDIMQLRFNFAVPPGDIVYNDYITVSIDHPNVLLSPWQPSISPISHYDVSFKNTKEVFNSNFTITLTAQAKTVPLDNVHVHLTYYQHSNKKIIEQLFPISFIQAPSHNEKTGIPDKETKEISLPSPKQSNDLETRKTWSHYVSDIIKTTNSLWIKLVLVLILGILVSLTPCLYPMIPVTVGVLQSQCSTSLIRNVLFALLYTLGIASTFAIIGLVAVCTGQMIGTLMMHPFFISLFVMLLVYLGFSLLGLYPMYIPALLQKPTILKNSSLPSAFIFGAISGTVASPCLSPGLLLLLSIVTSLGSKLLGFLLLFFFGIGLCIPLLIIGTCTNMLSTLPKAGSWMIEIKKLFGFMLLGMSIYFLNATVPWYITMWNSTLLIAGAGVFYLKTGNTISSIRWRHIVNCMGSILVGTAIFLSFKSYQAIDQYYTPIDSMWFTDYKQACLQACKMHKKILLDVSAPLCITCKKIDSQLFTNHLVCKALEAVVPVKLDCSDTTNPALTKLQNKYQIKGAPTLLLIDPETNTAIKRWEGELEDVSVNNFISELNKYSKNKTPYMGKGASTHY